MWIGGFLIMIESVFHIAFIILAKSYIFCLQFRVATGWHSNHSENNWLVGRDASVKAEGGVQGLLARQGPVCHRAFHVGTPFTLRAPTVSTLIMRFPCALQRELLLQFLDERIPPGDVWLSSAANAQPHPSWCWLMAWLRFAQAGFSGPCYVQHLKLK